MMSSHLFTKLQAMRVSWIEILSTSKETRFYSNSEKKQKKNEGCSTKWNSLTVGHNFKQEAFFVLFVPFLSLCLKVSEAFIGSATDPLSSCHLSHTAHTHACKHTHTHTLSSQLQVYSDPKWLLQAGWNKGNHDNNIHWCALFKRGGWAGCAQISPVMRVKTLELTILTLRLFYTTCSDSYLWFQCFLWDPEPSQIRETCGIQWHVCRECRPKQTSIYCISVDYRLRSTLSFWHLEAL